MTTRELCKIVRSLCEGTGHDFVFITEDQIEWSFDRDKQLVLSKTEQFIRELDINIED